MRRQLSSDIVRGRSVPRRHTLAPAPRKSTPLEPTLHSFKVSFAEKEVQSEQRLSIFHLKPYTLDKAAMASPILYSWAFDSLLGVFTGVLAYYLRETNPRTAPPRDERLIALLKWKREKQLREKIDRTKS